MHPVEKAGRPDAANKGAGGIDDDDDDDDDEEDNDEEGGNKEKWVFGSP